MARTCGRCGVSPVRGQVRHAPDCPIKKALDGAKRLVTVCITVKTEDGDVFESQLQQLETQSRSIFGVNEVRCGTYNETDIYYPAKED